jgi:hypothetical protein
LLASPTRSRKETFYVEVSQRVPVSPIRFFLNAVNENNIEDMIKEGVMICSGGEAAATKGRTFSKRPTPW